MGIASKIAFVVVVYTALSSHEERPAFVSRPYGTHDEANEAAEGFPGLPTFRPKVFKLRDGGALERLYAAFEPRVKDAGQDGPDPD